MVKGVYVEMCAARGGVSVAAAEDGEEKLEDNAEKFFPHFVESLQTDVPFSCFALKDHQKRNWPLVVHPHWTLCQSMGKHAHLLHLASVPCF